MKSSKMVPVNIKDLLLSNIVMEVRMLPTMDQMRIKKIKVTRVMIEKKMKTKGTKMIKD